MKKTIEIWKIGWCVILRATLFSFALAITFLPLKLLVGLLDLKGSGAVFDNGEFNPDALLPFLGAAMVAVLLGPFLYYFASRISKEFIVPRDVQNQWLEDTNK
jgi:hypothetical protein